jgi:AAA+ ATPase superfamily predicted ATPase
MFTGRTRELNLLEERYVRNAYECIIVYGRRRNGKTALISKFCAGKKSIFFSAEESTAQANLRNLSEAVYQAAGGSGEAPVYSDFKTAFAAIAALAQKQKIVLVIDEYPYLAKAYPGISSLLQVLIDHTLSKLNIMLILCGSSMSFMQEQLLGRKSPLYGRRTGQIRLGPLDFTDIKAFLPHASAEDLAFYQAVTGGIPQYLKFMDDSRTLEQNLKQNFFDTGGYLFAEPSALLNQELRDPASYNAVLEAVASGASRINDIALRAGISRESCAICLKNLTALEITERQTPFGARNTNKTLYCIADGMFRFWYRFVGGCRTLIERGMGEAAFSKIRGELSDFMGQGFERLCLNWLREMNRRGLLPFVFEQAGRWWGTDPRTKTRTKVDIVAGETQGSMLFCECKWRNEPAAAQILDTLIRRSELFSASRRCCIVFSKNGFTHECREKAARLPDVRLLSFAEMIEQLNLKEDAAQPQIFSRS